MDTLLVGINAKYVHSSLAVYSLAAACRQRSLAIQTAEYTINQDLLFILRDILKQEPRTLGIACYIWNIEMVWKLVAAIKALRPDLVIIIGGPEVSFGAEELLHEHPAINYIIQGEGEESFSDLIFALQSGNSVSELPGVSGHAANRSVFLGDQCVVENLDSLPFPYCEAELRSLNNRIVYYESSRGCPFSCSYCLSSGTAGVRQKSIEIVKQDLAQLLQAGVRQIKFVDRTFNIKPEHYRAIWRFLLSRQEKTNCHFEIVADLLDEEDFQILEHAPPGRFQFEIGIQTLMPQSLNAIGRKHNWERLSENVRRLKNMKSIHLHLDLIAGLPFEGLVDFRNSFNAVYSLRPDMLQLGFLKMLPGAPIQRSAEEFDYKVLQHPPYEILSNRFLSYSDVALLKQVEEVLNQIYNSGRFSFALKFMIEHWEGDAFGFFVEFSRWWENEGMFGASHSAEKVLSAVRHFAIEKMPLLNSSWVMELLKADVMMDPAGSLQGRELTWNTERWLEAKNNFWRNELKVRKYVPEYWFSNWRDIKREYPIEVFAVDVAGWLADGKMEQRATAILFIKEKGTTPRWMRLDPVDFLLGDA